MRLKTLKTVLIHWMGLGMGFVACAEEKTWDMTPGFSLYSESSYAGKTGFLINESKLHLNLVRNRSIFALYGGMAMSQAAATASGDPGNYVAVYPGIKFQPEGSPVGAFLEYWAIATEERQDFRGGIYAYKWLTLPESLPIGLFGETGGKGIYSSRLNRDLFLTAWSRLGHRFDLGTTVATDLFFEGVIKRDRLGKREENLQELGPGIRTSFLFAPFSAAVLGNYAMGTYAGRSAGSYGEWKGLLTFSGEI